MGIESDEVTMTKNPEERVFRTRVLLTMNDEKLGRDGSKDDDTIKLARITEKLRRNLKTLRLES
jgi:hypothetical protein